ncbi:nucleotidyltransferase domain-containing protein [Candidatus Woesearchaeota archaeon]|nr:nucleotidyltransferase domain-containing protein [Candidatus Woesearchaeota archaeon]
MITKENNLKVMRVFFENPSKEFHLRQLSRITGISLGGILKIIPRLKKEKLLLSRKERNTELVSPNFEGRFTIFKRLYNVQSLYDTGLIATLQKWYEQPKTIILFGSYSRGIDTEKSDIDIAVFTNSKPHPDLSIFERKLSRKINIHVINDREKNNSFKNSLANGIVLEGVMELI